MKILIICPCPREFGGFYRADHTARALVERGHQVEMLFYARRGWPRGPRRLEPIPGLTWIELATRGPRLIDKLLKIPAVVAHALFSSADVVHIFTAVHPECFAALLLCKLFNRKVVLDWDDYWQDSGLGTSATRWMAKYIRFTENQGIKLASGVTVTSAFLARKASELGCTRVHIMPNGTWEGQIRLQPRQDARAALGIGPDQLVLFAFGNSFLNGRGRLIVNCAQAILNMGSDVLVLVNLEPLRNLWQAEFQDDLPPPSELVLQKFRNVGRVAERDLGLYLGAADFALFLVRDVPAEQACFPIRIGAYLSGECPIAANETNTEACRIVKQFGCGVIGTDTAQTAHLILEASRNPKRMEQLRAAAREARVALNYGRIAEAAEKFYAGIGIEGQDIESAARNSAGKSDDCPMAGTPPKGQ